MNPASQVLPLESLRPGMHLAEPIRDRFGNIMLASGTELTESHLSALAQRGIASAMIVPERIPPTDEEIEAMRHATQERLHQIFRKSLDWPANAKLCETLIAYRLEHLK